MLTTIRNRIASVRGHLTSLGDQPLGKAALTVILLLDLFILTSIFDGLDRHTQQLQSPSERIPVQCQEIVIDGRWNRANLMDSLFAGVRSVELNPMAREQDRAEAHPHCLPVLSALDAVQKDAELVRSLRERDRLRREAAALRAQAEAAKGAYDTSLLETLADRASGQPRVDALQREMHARTDALNGVTSQLASVEGAITQRESYRALVSRIDAVTEAEREQLREELRDLNFWYPAKKLAMQMAFLLPLLAVFLFWNTASIRRNRGVQTLVSSHLLVVAFIPVLFKIAELVYDILPRRFLKEFIELLETLKLVAIWHYLVIALAIAAALAVIYFFQKKLFSRDKLIERRIARGQCQQCGKAVPSGSNACTFCGFAQYRACGHCNQPTFVHGKFCRACGQAQSGP